MVGSALVFSFLQSFLNSSYFSFRIWLCYGGVGKVAYLRILYLSQCFGQEDDSAAADFETELLPISVTSGL